MAYEVTTGNRHVYSDECAPGGSGNCDGYTDRPGEGCDCSCHGAILTDFRSVTEAAAWHEDLWAGYGPDNPYLPIKAEGGDIRDDD